MNQARMTIAAALLAGSGSPACAKPPETPGGAKTEKKPMRVEQIEETTVGGMDGWRIGVANAWKDKWVRDDGTEAEGMSVTLYLVDAAGHELPGRRVGEGATIMVAGKRWRVTHVGARGERGKRGFIELTEQP